MQPTTAGRSVRSFARALVLPFFVTLFPALWYVNRNLTTAVLPPNIEPTTELVLWGVVGSVLLSLVVSLCVAPITYWIATGGERPREKDRFRRVLLPDRRELLVVSVLLVGLLLFALTDLAGFDTAVGVIGWPFALAVGLPMLAVAPLAIHSHFFTVFGLTASAVWMIVLGTFVVDLFNLSKRMTAD